MEITLKENEVDYTNIDDFNALYRQIVEKQNRQMIEAIKNSNILEPLKTEIASHYEKLTHNYSETHRLYSDEEWFNLPFSTRRQILRPAVKKAEYWVKAISESNLDSEIKFFVLMYYSASVRCGRRAIAKLNTYSNTQYCYWAAVQCLPVTKIGI